MSTEQLKMILDALQNLGAEGKDAFVWWLVMHEGLGPVTWLITLAGLLMLARWIIGAVSRWRRMEQLREELGISDYDRRDQNYERTVDEALARIRKSKA